jgi:hypothetical protein
MRVSAVACGGATLILLLAAPTAHAELIHWMYEWSRTPEIIQADNPGNGYIALTGEGVKAVAGDSDVVATNLRTYSTAPNDKPDRFTAKAYSLSLYVFDMVSQMGGTLHFTGQLDGVLTENSANIKNTFTSATTQILVLGRNVYTAKIGPYSAPGPTGSTNSGSISGHLTITVESMLASVPEPNTLVLSSLGTALLAWAGLRGRPLGLLLPPGRRIAVVSEPLRRGPHVT